jgi:very-short-patch-repair endonuclease
MEPVLYARLLGFDAIVANQQGVIRRDQAVAAGLTLSRIDDLIRRGKWVRILPRVYLVGGGSSSVAVRLRACWLWAGDQSAITGAAAAWWWGLTTQAPSCISVVIPMTTRRDPQPGIRVVRGTVDPLDVDFQDWVRLTTIAKTCLDLARMGEPDRLEVALRLRRSTPAKLEASLQRGRGRRGQVLARRAVVEAGSNPWSSAERLAHRHLQRAGIKGWTANPPIHLRGGIRYPDIAVEDIKLAIEIDGRSHHDNSLAFERDRERRNEFVRDGWTVLQFTWKVISEQPEKFVTDIADTIDVLRSLQRG